MNFQKYFFQIFDKTQNYCSFKCQHDLEGLQSLKIVDYELYDEIR